MNGSATLGEKHEPLSVPMWISASSPAQNGLPGCFTNRNQKQREMKLPRCNMPRDYIISNCHIKRTSPALPTKPCVPWCGFPWPWEKSTHQSSCMPALVGAGTEVLMVLNASFRKEGCNATYPSFPVRSVQHQGLGPFVLFAWTTLLKVGIVQYPWRISCLFPLQHQSTHKSISFAVLLKHRS